MNIDVVFHEEKCAFDADFGEVQTASDGGYERGYAEGYGKGETAAKAEAEAHNEEILTDCNAVLPTKGVETADTLEQVPQRIGEIDAEGAELWKYLHTFYKTFQDTKFPSGYEVALTVPNLNPSLAVSQVIYGATGIRKLTIICGREDAAINSYFAFGNCASIEEIDLSRFSNNGTVKITTGDYLFYRDTKLREIKGILDFSNCTKMAGLFENCSALEEVRFVEGSVHISLAIGQSQNLSADSIQSIIDGLADLTGATTQTLTLHATVGNKLTEAQKATITAKNWTLVY